MARALRVRRPGGRCHVAVRGHDRKAIFRRQSALVNAKSALQRLPGPAASELLSGAAVGNHRPNWTPVPTRPPAAPPAAFKSQRDFGPQPNGCEARAIPGATDSNGVVANATVAAPGPPAPKARFNASPGQRPGNGFRYHPRPEKGESNPATFRRRALRSPPHRQMPPLPHRHWRQTNCPCPKQIVAERPRK
jgi:hypothetical protein